MPVIPVLGNLRQDCGEFESSLDYKVSSKPIRIAREILSQVRDGAVNSWTLQHPAWTDWKNPVLSASPPTSAALCWLLTRLCSEGPRTDSEDCHTRTALVL